MFITFEGGEGAGKTTQIELLAEKLTSSGYDIVLTREPGGTPEAEKIRDLLVQRDGGEWSPLAEAMLFYTARHMHVETKIKPALLSGKTVICDRFTDSTNAYQGFGHGFSLDRLAEIKKITIGAFKPDITFILDIPVRKGIERAQERINQTSKTQKASLEDRFERLDKEFHERLRQGFLSIAAMDKKRCKVIDALQPKNNVHREILSYLKDHYDFKKRK